MQSVGQRIREIRRKKDITQTDLAEAIGRAQQEIYRMERGKLRIPADELPAIAKALNVSIDAFFVDDEIMEPVHAD